MFLIFLSLIRNGSEKSVPITVKGGFGFIRLDGRSPIILLVEKLLNPEDLVKVPTTFLVRECPPVPCS